jgi:hypothetical protein
MESNNNYHDEYKKPYHICTISHSFFCCVATPTTHLFVNGLRSKTRGCQRANIRNALIYGSGCDLSDLVEDGPS